jgi:hypothetical protein
MILENIFFAFWNVYGDFWTALWACVIAMALISMVVYVITKR